MKLIFLDIDGVLVTRRVGVFEERLLGNLKKVVDSTGAQIVLSSDWRRHPFARAEAQREMGKRGLGFISCTPCMNQFVPQRPTEIMTWRREHERKVNAEPVSNWVVIDDRALLEERHGTHLRSHFVQTHPLRGFTDAAADECIRILNREHTQNEKCNDDRLSVFTPTPSSTSRVGAQCGGEPGTRGVTPQRMRSTSSAGVNLRANANPTSPGTMLSNTGSFSTAFPRSRQRGVSVGAVPGVRRPTHRP